MNEAKSLVHMAVSAMFAALIIGAAMSLIGIGYKMWNYFSRQDMANQKMKDYVNYVAYDDTTIHGQEVISLIKYAEDEGIFVAIISQSTQTPGTNDINHINPVDAPHTVHFYVPDTCPWERINDERDNIPTAHANSGISTGLSMIKSRMRTIDGNRDNVCLGNCDNHKCLNETVTGSYSNLVKAFTNTYSNYDHLGYPLKKGQYAAYKSVLVYDSDISTSVIGVMLIKQNVDTTQY